ncbi:hypothetical protein [Mycolicibacterium sp. HS_4_1]
MVEQDKMQAALALVKGRLHTAAGSTRCGCGPCAHQVATAARRAGIPRQRLEAALAPVAKPDRLRQARRPEPMRTWIGDSSTIRPRGHDGNRDEGLSALLSRLHRPGPDAVVWPARLPATPPKTLGDR